MTQRMKTLKMMILTLWFELTSVAFGPQEPKEPKEPVPQVFGGLRAVPQVFSSLGFSRPKKVWIWYDFPSDFLKGRPSIQFPKDHVGDPL